MKLTALLFAIIAFSTVQASDFVVQSFEKVSNDLSARRYERIDVNDIPCAIIKIQTDIPTPFVFDANLGVVGDIEYKEDNVIWVYVSEGERQITLAKEGFVTLNYPIPLTITKSTTYSLIIKAKDSIISVAILSNPSDAVKYIDGERLGSGNSFLIEAGNHNLELRKDGYATVSKDIVVSKEDAFFNDLNLSPKEPILLSFSTNPTGAKVFINNVEEGKTNLQLFHFPGKYDVRISKSNYESIEEVIVVSREDINDWEYDLVKTTGTLKIVTIPIDANTYINGKLYSTKNIDLAPGQYHIEVRSNGWISESRNIVVGKGVNQTQSFKLSQLTGALQLIVIPNDAKVRLNKGTQRVDSWVGSFFKKDIPVGEYVISFSQAGYITQSKTVIIKDKRTTNLSVSLVLNPKPKNAVKRQSSAKKHTVTDIDGNTYRTIKIGNKVWMAENLKVTHYRNGDGIRHLSERDSWKSTNSGAYCFYDNAVGNGRIYGALYNWHAVGDSRGLAPKGWHVATDSDWKELEMYLGMWSSEANDTGLRGTNEANKLKESGTLHWKSPNSEATNDLGFSVLPGGDRSFKSGIFSNLGSYGYFWTGSEGASDRAWDRKFYYRGTDISRGNNLKRLGYSIRCVKN
jgi:uncharacterized protein (TIGR02145 family)